MKKILPILLTLHILSAGAQPGTLDPTFGNFGISLGPFVNDLSHGNAIVQQADGKTVVAGHLLLGGNYDLFIVRYNVDGTIDDSFSGDGVVVSNFGNTSYARAIAVQDDGKIVIAGDIDNIPSTDFFLQRYETSGEPDSSFGDNGTVISDFGNITGDQSAAMVLQPDGKIVVTGWTYNGDKDIVLMRYLGDGSLDSTFGLNGKVITDYNHKTQESNAIALQADGKIVVTGFTYSNAAANNTAVFRYTANGVLDSTFSGDGIALPSISNDDDEGNAVAVQADGKIVVAGYSYSNNTFLDNLLLRFDSAGIPDSTFNATGIVKSDINGFDNWANSVLIQEDGKIITAGVSYGNSYDASLSRFNTDGTVDETFGTGGHVSTAVGIEDDYIQAALLQPDNKIVTTGYYTDGGLENLFTARYDNNGIATIVNNPADADEVLIFPQPASSFITVKGAGLPAKYTMEIISITSPTAITNFANNGSTGIDISSLPAGMYVLKINDLESGHVLYRKFIKA